MIERLLSSNAFLIGIEVMGLILAVAFSLVFKEQLWLTRFENVFCKFAYRRRLSILVVSLAVVVGRLALLPVFPVPVPGVHDEFSYLLNGGTFAMGRLTNPASPMWPFFESFHILQQPTYASMYPVAPGLFLAAGFRLGLPWLGVLLAMALFCGAVTWALQGWVSPPLALLGGILAVLKFGLVSYWIDSYWGGAVPALGGALVLGAVPRLVAGKQFKHSLLLAVGFLLLANSRPFEGLIVAAISLAWLMVAILRRSRVTDTLQLQAIAVPVCICLFAGAILMGIYFDATTGSAFKMPYVRYAEQYSMTPAFWWQGTRPEPAFHNSVMRSYYEHELPEYRRAHTFSGWSSEVYRKVSSFAMFYLWPGILLVAFTVVKVAHTSAGRVSLLIIAALMAGISVEVWPMMLHYPAPATAATLLLLVCSLRAIRSFRIGRHQIGVALSRAVPSICLAALSLRTIGACTGSQVPDHGLVSLLTVTRGNLDRVALISQLSRLSGLHLVIVRYSPSHDLSHEWVYNSPSIETAHVIWARDMGPENNIKLVRYFAKRSVWLVEPDTKPILLRPYNGHTAQPSLSFLISR